MRAQLFLLAFLSIHCGATDTGGGDEVVGTGGASTGGSRDSVFSQNRGSGGGSGAGVGGSSGGTGSGTGGSASGGFSCADPGVFACDDFEAQSVGSEPSGPWVVVKDPYMMPNPWSAKVSSEKAHSGSSAVKVSAGGGWTNRVLIGAPDLFPVSGNHFFFRFWAYYEKPFGIVNDGQHMSYALATGPFTKDVPGDEIRLGVHGDILNVNFRGGPTFGDPQLKAYTDGDKHQVGIEPIVQEWVCTEIEFDGETDTINFWRNDEAIGELHTAPNEVPTTGEVPTRPWMLTYADVRFGWQSYGGVAMDAFYDDVVISTNRIGCTGP